MAETAPLVDERIHGEMVSLVGTGRIGHFLGILCVRLEGMGRIDDGPLGEETLAEIHRVVSEAGCLGFSRLSSDCRSLERALQEGDADDAAAAAARAAESMRRTLDEIRVRRAA